MCFRILTEKNGIISIFFPLNLQKIQVVWETELSSIMKKDKLRTRVFNSAWEIVEREGMAQLNVRKIAKLSDCSLGSIYNSFENFQALQLHINATVLSNLFLALKKVIESGIEEDKTLRQIFKDLGNAYIEFGYKNKFLWKAVFEHFPVNPLPEWYSKRAREGIYQICDRLAAYFKIPEEEMRHKVGFFWASIHGMSAILLNRKMEMVADLFKEGSLSSYIDNCTNSLFPSETLEATSGEMRK